MGLSGLFWHKEERRMRAVWRLVLHGAVLVTLVMGLLFVTVVPLVVARLFAAPPDDNTAVTDVILYSPAGISMVSIVVLAATVAATWLAGRFFDRRRFADFGLAFDRAWWADFGFGLLLGAGLMTLVFLVELAAGWITVTGSFAVIADRGAFAGLMLVAAAHYICVGIYEELLSRGYHLTNIAEGLRALRISPAAALVLAALLSSMVFGALHIGNFNSTVISTVNIALAGIMLALGYVLTGEIAIPIGLHITWNFFQGNVFGFPVSGMPANLASVLTIEQGGPALLTGGDFGPEAGLVGVTAMLIGCALIALWVKVRRGSLALHLPIAEMPEKPEPLFNRGKQAAQPAVSTSIDITTGDSD